MKSLSLHINNKTYPLIPTESLIINTKNLISSLPNITGINGAEEHQIALLSVIALVYQIFIDAEFDAHLGTERYEHDKNRDNFRNGSRKRKVKTNFGEISINFPSDRNSTFKSILLGKYSRNINDISEKILSMFKAGLTHSQIKSIVEEIFGTKISGSTISTITDRIYAELENWQNRPLLKTYTTLFIDGIYFPVRDVTDDNKVKRMPVHLIVGIDSIGNKDVLSMNIHEKETCNTWEEELKLLQKRGVEEVMIVASDSIPGIKTAIQNVFPDADNQKCIVHKVRNVLSLVDKADRAEMAEDLRSIYTAKTIQEAKENRDKIAEKWKPYYGNVLRSWIKDWDTITTMFTYSEETREFIFTTNIIESINSSLKHHNFMRRSFNSKNSLSKHLFGTIVNLTEKWNKNTNRQDMMKINLNISEIYYSKKYPKAANI